MKQWILTCNVFQNSNTIRYPEPSLLHINTLTKNGPPTAAKAVTILQFRTYISFTKMRELMPTTETKQTTIKENERKEERSLSQKRGV